MSYVTSFMDGEKYGADDINKIVSRFVHSGIEEAFVDGEPYNVRRLNDLSKPITTRGVIGSESSALLVTKSGDEYYISPGTAFFGNGSTIEVIENEVITLADSTLKNYVYLVSSEEENRNYIEVSTTEPDVANENFVMLAEIAADGTITDRRCYATGKLRGMYQDNNLTLKSIRIQDTVYFPEDNHDMSIIHDLGCSDFRMMILVAYEATDNNGYYADSDVKGRVSINDHNSLAVWFKNDNKFFGLAHGSSEGNNGFCHCFDSDGSMDGDWRAGKYVVKMGVYQTYLTITHSNGTEWSFNYHYNCGYFTASTTKVDLRLFYI